MMFTDVDPGADPRLATVIAAAKAPAELPMPGEAGALSAYRRRGRSWMRTHLNGRPAHMLAAALSSGVIVAGGVAAAATGALPVPAALHHATAATQAPTATTAAASSGSHSHPAGHASHSPAAVPTDHPSGGVLGSVAKGEATCTAASHARCQAGRHGKAAEAHHHALPSAVHSHPALRGHSAHSGQAPHGFLRSAAPARTKH